jgi:Putative bacterial sensory transduction regulator
MINPDEVPMPLTNGRVAGQVHQHGIRFGPGSEGGVVASFGDSDDSDKAVFISLEVEGDDECPIFVVTSTTRGTLDAEQAVRAVAVTNRWNAAHRFPTSVVQAGPDGSSVLGTQFHLPAGAGLTDTQLHDLVGLAVSSALQFWRELESGDSAEEGLEEGAA